MQQYQFTFGTGKGLWEFLLYFLGIPFVLMILSFLLSDACPWIFWVSIPLLIVSWIRGFRRLIKLSKVSDQVELDDKGFSSLYYGRVNFADIESIPPFNALQAAPPSMRMLLKSGKKLYWIFNGRPGVPDPNKEQFIAFRDALLAKLTMDNQPSGDIANNAGAQSMQPELRTGVVEQLKAQKKRDINFKYYTIPIGLAFGLIAAVRNCGEDWVKQRNEREMQMIRDGFASMERDYQDNLEKSRQVIADYSRGLGPVYLLTNDPDAQLKYLPDLPASYDYSTGTSSVITGHNTENKLLEKVIARPDSFSYQLILYSEPVDDMIELKPGVLSEPDSSTAEVYLAVYNPDKALESKFSPAGDTSFRPIRYTSSVSIPRTGPLRSGSFNSMSYASVRSLLQIYEGTYFYLALKAAEGVDEARFDEVCKWVLQDFEKQKIDTDAFQTRIFNQ